MVNSPPPQAETATGHVNGIVATRSGTGTKTDTPLIETPAAISVVTQDQVQAQAAQSPVEAVRYTSGVSTESTGADRRFEDIYIRGCIADKFLDSMRLTTAGYASMNIEPFNLERIEVLHGPASILYGQASPGGLLNMVSKMPTAVPYNEMFISTGNYGRIQGGVDMSGPLDKDANWLYRFTASAYDVGSQVDHVDYQRISVAPSLTWRPDMDTSVTFQALYQKDPKAGFFNQLPQLGTIQPFPDGTRIPTNFYAGEPSVDRMTRETYAIGYLAEHNFDNGLTVRQNLRYSEQKSDITAVFSLGNTPADPYTLDRYAFSEADTVKSLTVDNQVEGKFTTGPFEHTTLFGIDFRTGSFGYDYAEADTVPGINVKNPVYGVPVSFADGGAANQKFGNYGFYAQDQIKLDRWVGLFGVRWDHATVNTTNYNPGGGLADIASQSDSATTKRAALLYKFDNGVAPYIQYTESFQPSTGTDSAHNAFKPTTGQQEEIGIKYQPNAKSLYTMALFNLVQQNVLTPDPVHLYFNTQTGEIRSRGLELEGKTELTENLSLIASYTYLDQVITKSSADIEIGRHPFGIPMNSASLWGDYTFHSGPLDGFGASAGVRYLGETAGSIDTADVVKVPDVTLFDAALHYDLAALGPQFKGFKAQINASNLFDKTYVGYCQDGGCYYGLRRQVIATLRYRW